MANKDFTPRELGIMAKAWTCMLEEPKVDYNKLAEACGMSNPRSAANAWRAIKAKVMMKGGIAAAGGEAGEGLDDSTPKPTPKKRGKGKAEDDDGESPTKKVKDAKARNGKKAADDEAENGGKVDRSLIKEEEDMDVHNLA